MVTIQLQAVSTERIIVITELIRKIVSDVCLGVDDVHLLGNKAVVFRAEIYPKKIALLCDRLAEAKLSVDPSTIPDYQWLDSDCEYPLTLQITSYSDDTDGRVVVPSVPG